MARLERTRHAARFTRKTISTDSAPHFSVSNGRYCGGENQKNISIGVQTDSGDEVEVAEYYTLSLSLEEFERLCQFVRGVDGVVVL